MADKYVRFPTGHKRSGVPRTQASRNIARAKMLLPEKDRRALHPASPRSTRVRAIAGTIASQESIAALPKNARLKPYSRSAATRSGKPNAKSRIQGFDGGVDNWTRPDKACRLDAGDRHIFDHCDPFPHRVLFFAGQRRFLRPRPLALLGWTFHGMRNKVTRFCAMDPDR
jgi:hypothetical protein